ncbi:cobalamin B12-binding domain-containing protein [Dehalobacter restrictus]|uniref:Cobalamin-binding protein n=1 Tax=Dehalobacter restrictus (strain DSM 9455 / PER-K23) TaxID=871738 RepID=A0ABM5P6Y2_DEHRP|nr:cobalamin-dependent protein [Dehalobacter restrictus]AHF10470.1 cobalamin-binding protein [Dehalobacter restrictus DSM 9455]
MFELNSLKVAFADLDEAVVRNIISDFIRNDPSEYEAKKAVEACQQGMADIGRRYDQGEYFLGDLINAGDLLAASIALLKPVLGSGRSGEAGTIILGTVSGDIHDIGKNVFKELAEAGGFQVWDLGIDQPPGKFIKVVNERIESDLTDNKKPLIVGMSGVLTLTLEAMKNTVESLEEAGLRKQVKVIAGGTPLTAKACRWIGADAFTSSAAEGLKICREWVSCRS